MERKVDYIIVGFGVAGACFAEQALLNGKSFVVIDGGKPSASRTAGGTLNPVVLKRFNAVWKVQEFFFYARDFYTRLQSRLGTSFLIEIPIYRYFHDTEEQNDWLVASDQRDLTDFLDPQVHHFPEKSWNSTMGFGKVLQSMRLDTTLLLNSFKEQLKAMDAYKEEVFQYDALQTLNRGVGYRDIIASKVIFAEGVHAQENPFFPSHLLIPKKGEYILVNAPNHGMEGVLKGKYFYIPIDKDTIKIGATFAHGDNTDATTENGKTILMQAAQKRFSIPLTWKDQVVGKRPTVKDRRPLLGSISDGSPYVFLNGLGTRGLLLAPYLSKQLFEHLEEGKPLDEEISIRRFISEPFRGRT